MGHPHGRPLASTNVHPPENEDAVHVPETHTNCFNILGLKVCGLMSKLNMTILEEYISNFDMICLSETKLDMGDIKGYSPIFHHRMGAARKSGWITLYIREEYSEHIQALKGNNHEHVIWLKLDKEILGFDLIIGTVYIPPVNSTYYHGDEFDILTHSRWDLLNVLNFDLG